MPKLRNILCIFIFVPFFAHAQALDPVQFVISPETPGPFEEVTIRVEGVGSFLGDSSITWRANGAVVLSGVGERIYRFATGALGSQTVIAVSISSQEKGLIERTFTFRPSLVNILWEADTTAPLFYRGKPLYSAGSALKAAAIPTIIINNSLVSIQSLSFQWSLNGEPAVSQSGLGRSSILFTGDQLRASEEVEVDVFFGSVRVGRGSVTIPATAPFVLFYNRDPLQGEVLDNALPAAISLEGAEVTLQAEPYYFSRASKSSNLLSYSWTLNGEEIVGPDTERGLLTLRQAGEGVGRATVGIEVQNTDPDRFVQTAEMALGIVFGESAATALQSFFGL
jgi:hypothetical protein